MKHFMAEPINGRRNFVGQLVGVEGEAVTVDVEGVAHVLPLQEIRKAWVVGVTLRVTLPVTLTATLIPAVAPYRKTYRESL